MDELILKCEDYSLMKWDGNSTLPIQKDCGDRYAERLLDSNGNFLFSGEDILEIIDFSMGEGILKYDKISKYAPKTRAADKSVSAWVLWSCVDVEVNQAQAMDPKLEVAVDKFQSDGQEVIYDFKGETEVRNGLTK